MQEIDFFLRARVAQHLLPGEVPTGFAFLRHPQRLTIANVPIESTYEDFLAVITATRLILFESGHTFTGEPKAEAGACTIWSFDEIASVNVGQVAGIRFTAANWFYLNPHPTLGPLNGKGRRYDVISRADGLAEQKRICDTFGPWLQQQVACNAFPLSPARRAEIDARLASEAAAQAAHAAASKAATDAFIKQWLPIGIKVGIALPIVVTFIIGTMVLTKAVSHYASTADRDDEANAKLAQIEADKRVVQSGKVPLTGCAPTARTCRSCTYETFHAASEDSKYYVFFPDARGTRGPSGALATSSSGWKCSSALGFSFDIEGVESSKRIATEARERYIKDAIGGAVAMLLAIAAAAGLLVWQLVLRKKPRSPALVPAR